MRREFYEPIYIPGDGSAITEMFAKMGIKIEWKPIIMPLINKEDIKPIILGDCEEHKFTFATPKPSK